MVRRCVGGHLGLGELDPHRAPVRREQELALEGAHRGRSRGHVLKLDERNRHAGDGGGGCGHVVVVDEVMVVVVDKVVVVVVVVVTSSVSGHSGSSSSIGSSDGGALTVHTEATKARQTVGWLSLGLIFGCGDDGW